MCQGLQGVPIVTLGVMSVLLGQTVRTTAQIVPQDNFHEPVLTNVYLAGRDSTKMQKVWRPVSHATRDR
jgi:hypothetical protein